MTGLAKAFQKELSRAVAGLWRVATNTDRRWSKAESTAGRLNWTALFRQKYFNLILRAWPITTP
jgi:hypothetical protein